MAVRTAKAQWDGNLQQGRGRMSFGSGAFDGAYSFASRFAEEKGTNPEELIAAAHAGCFSMALAHAMSLAGHKVTSVDTTATVHLNKVGDGMSITGIDLVTTGAVPGMDQATFAKFAEDTKAGCIVSLQIRSAISSRSMTMESALRTRTSLKGGFDVFTGSAQTPR